MNFNKLLLYCVFTIGISCKGQNFPKPTNDPPAIALGDSVAQLDPSIWYVFQASNLDYWFGSDTNGVYRFDGKHIIHFSTKHGLSSNRIRGIQEDKMGNLYFTTLDNIQRFDGQNFTTLKISPGIPQTDHWKLQDGDLWFSILGKNKAQGFYRYDGNMLYPLQFPKHPMADEYYKIFGEKPWSPYDVYYIYKDSKGIMWFGTSNFGVCRYDGVSFNWLYEDHLTNTPEGGSFGIRSILEDAKGKFWICNTRYRYAIASDSTIKNGYAFIKYQKEMGIDDLKIADRRDHIYFMSAVLDSNGAIWMATYSQGVWKYDGKISTHYPVRAGGKDITLFSIYQDKLGQLWLGSHEEGVYKFNGKTFEKFLW